MKETPKRARFGIECYILAEAKTGYVWNLDVYVEKEIVSQYDNEGLLDEQQK